MAGAPWAVNALPMAAIAAWAVSAGGGVAGDQRAGAVVEDVEDHHLAAVGERRPRWRRSGSSHGAGRRLNRRHELRGRFFGLRSSRSWRPRTRLIVDRDGTGHAGPVRACTSAQRVADVVGPVVRGQIRPQLQIHAVQVRPAWRRGLRCGRRDRCRHCTLGPDPGLMPVHRARRHAMLASELGRVDLTPAASWASNSFITCRRVAIPGSTSRPRPRSLTGDTCVGTSSATDVMGLR